MIAATRDQIYSICEMEGKAGLLMFVLVHYLQSLLPSLSLRWTDNIIRMKLEQQRHEVGMKLMAVVSLLINTTREGVLNDHHHHRIYSNYWA